MSGKQNSDESCLHPCVPSSLSHPLCHSFSFTLLYSQKGKKTVRKISRKKWTTVRPKRDLIDRGEKVKSEKATEKDLRENQIPVPFKINRIGRFAIIYREEKRERDPSRNKFPVIFLKKNVPKTRMQKEHGRDTKRGTETWGDCKKAEDEEEEEGRGS